MQKNGSDTLNVTAVGDDNGYAWLGYWFHLHYLLVRICNSLEITLPRIPSGDQSGLGAIRKEALL